jgi:replicative DNA helicase
MFLYRPEYYRRQIKSEQAAKRKRPDDVDNTADEQNITGLLEVMVEKHRNGPTGTAKLCFVPESMSITDWTELNPDAYGARQ